MTHLSIERLQMLDSLADHWNGIIDNQINSIRLVARFVIALTFSLGPMSIALYITDRDVPNLMSFIQLSASLSNRKDIGYHLTYVQGVSIIDQFFSFCCL